MSSANECSLHTNSSAIPPSHVPMFLYSDIEKHFVTIVNPTLLLFGLVSNTGFLFVILRIPRMKTTVNLCLANLALSDSCFLTMAVLDKLFRLLVSPISNDQLMLGVPGCVLTGYTTNLFYFASLFLITLISTERYFAICQPIKHRIVASKPRTVKYLLTTWITSAVFAGLLLPLHSKLQVKCIWWPPGYFHLPISFGYCTPITASWRQWGAFWKVAPFFVSLLMNVCLYTLIIRSLGGKVGPMSG